MRWNQITEIKGLDKLKNLKRLYINSNKISEIKDLGSLTKLKVLNIGDNSIPEEEFDELGGLNEWGEAIKAQKFEKYCKNKKIFTYN